MNKNVKVQLLAAIQNYMSCTKIIKTTCVSKIINTCHDPKQQNNIKIHLVCKFTRMITSHISQKRKEKKKRKREKEENIYYINYERKIKECKKLSCVSTHYFALISSNFVKSPMG